MLTLKTKSCGRFNKIQNVFAATDPRQRSTPIQEEIFKLQRQHYEDDLPEIQYQTTLQDLLKELTNSRISLIPNQMNLHVYQKCM